MDQTLIGVPPAFVRRAMALAQSIGGNPKSRPSRADVELADRIREEAERILGVSHEDK